MSASTWFQGSAWRPSSQGMHPSGRCTAAMASAVCSACAALRTPGTSGSTVEDQALAQDGIEGPLAAADDAVPVDDVPDQEAVVLTDRPDLAIGADQAAQPPVRRVQGVDVVLAHHPQAGRGQPAAQLVPP